MGRLSIPTRAQIAEAIRLVNRWPWRPDEDIALPPKKPPGPEYQMTLQEVGDHLGVSRERVRQIEARALAKCRKWCDRHGVRLEDLLNSSK